MEATHRAMKNNYEAENVSLHVRCSNRAALGLYKHRLQYKSSDIEAKYYADGEDAYYMVKELVEGYNLGIDADDLADVELNLYPNNLPKAPAEDVYPNNLPKAQEEVSA